MLSVVQKVVALGVILLMNVLVLLFSPVLGVLGLFASLPLAVVILRR
jgi:hypothetical protein